MSQVVSWTVGDHAAQKSPSWLLRCHTVSDTSSRRPARHGRLMILVCAAHVTNAVCSVTLRGKDICQRLHLKLNSAPCTPTINSARLFPSRLLLARTNSLRFLHLSHPLPLRPTPTQLGAHGSAWHDNLWRSSSMQLHIRQQLGFECLRRSRIIIKSLSVCHSRARSRVVVKWHLTLPHDLIDHRVACDGSLLARRRLTALGGARVGFVGAQLRCLYTLRA